MEFFFCNRRKIAVKPTNTKIQLPQKSYGENFKITGHKYRFSILKITVFLADIDNLVKLLSNQATLSLKSLENI